MIEDYASAKEIAQDRANRGGLLMYLFKRHNDGYYITTQYEHPYVARAGIEFVEEVWPEGYGYKGKTYTY